MAEELSGERGDGVTVPGDDAALADERLAAARIDWHVRIRALAVEGEQIGHAERIAVILLDDGAAIHAEHTDVAVDDGIVIDKYGAAVGEVGLHAVALHADRVGRALRIVRPKLIRLEVLALDRGGDTGGGRLQIAVDDLRLEIVELCVVYKTVLILAALLLDVQNLAHGGFAPTV